MKPLITDGTGRDRSPDDQPPSRTQVLSLP